MADEVGRGGARRPGTTARRVALRVLLVTVLLLVGVLAYQVTRTAVALRAAEADASVLSRDLRERDLDAAESTVARLQDDARTARSHSDGWLWRASTLLPWVGDDARAVTAVAAAVDRLAAGGGPAVDLARTLESEDLRAPGGGVRLDVVESLAGPAERLARDAESGAALVDEVDPTTLLGPLERRVAPVLERIDQVRSVAAGAGVATRVLPEVLGGDGPRRYLLVVQNNAEVRATGGLPGSVAVLNTRDGRVSLGYQGSAQDFLVDRSAVASPDPGEDQVFGPLLLTDFRDANFTPDFPRAAELWARHAERAGPRTPVDGVIAVDPVTLAQVLDAAGPVEVAGTRLSGDDAVRTLLFDVYQDLPDREAQDRFFEVAAQGLLDALLRARADDTELVRTLGEAVGQRRLLVWARDEAVQQELASSAVAGALPSGTGRPEVGVYLNDGTGAKMQFFLRTAHDVASLGCRADGRQVVRVSTRLANVLDRPVRGLSRSVTGSGGAVARGDMRLQVRVFAPAGGELVGLEVDGERVDVGEGAVYDRQVTQFPVVVSPGEEVEVLAQLVGAPDQRTDPRLQWTPDIVWGPSEQVARSQC